MKVLVGCVLLCLFSECNSAESYTEAKRCGRPESGVGLIVRGRDFERGDFPWAVPLLRSQNGGTLLFFCGGTLVTLSHVVTGRLLTLKVINFFDKSYVIF